MQLTIMQDGANVGVDLPILNNGCASVNHVFNPTELAQCAEGKCSRCSRCCFLNAVAAIPVDIGQAYMPKEGDGRGKNWFKSKGAGETCCQHSWNESGLSTCACHHLKGKAPILGDCTEFEAGEYVYQDTRRMTRVRLFSPRSATDIEVMKDWYWRGLLSDIDPAENVEEAIDAIKCILKIADVFPLELLEAIGVRVHFNTLDSIVLLPLLDDLEKNCDPVVFRQFKDYILAA